MKHWYRTSPSRTISGPRPGEVKVTRTRDPSGNGSRVSTNIPDCVMLRPMPAATPRSPSRYTGKALSKRVGNFGSRRGAAGLTWFSRLDMGNGATVGAEEGAVKERTSPDHTLATRDATSYLGNAGGQRLALRRKQDARPQDW